MTNAPPLLRLERIVSKIFLIRGIKVMLDSDLAEFSGVQGQSLKPRKLIDCP
jgi:hypothetical protein